MLSYILLQCCHKNDEKLLYDNLEQKNGLNSISHEFPFLSINLNFLTPSIYVRDTRTSDLIEVVIRQTPIIWYLKLWNRSQIGLWGQLTIFFSPLPRW